MTEPESAARYGLRRHQRQARSARVTGRAAIGSPPPALQVLRKLLGRGIAALGVLLQALQADRLEVAVDRRVDGARGLGLTRLHFFDSFQHGIGLEWRAPGQEGVEDGTQTVDVRRCGHGAAAAAGLLGGHVGRRAEDRSRLGQLDVAPDPLRQAEVGHIGLALGVEQDVRGLQVPVQHSALVGVMHRASHGADQSGRAPACVTNAYFPLPTSHQLGKTRAIDQLHRQITVPIVLADVIDGDDVGMVEVASGLRFILEPLERIARGMPAAQDHLQGHEPVETAPGGRGRRSPCRPAQLAEQLVIAKACHGAVRPKARRVIPGRAPVGRRRAHRLGAIRRHCRRLLDPGFGRKGGVEQRHGGGIEVVLFDDEPRERIGQIGVSISRACRDATAVS